MTNLSKERELAIRILEEIAELLARKKLASETIFDCKKGNSTWYDFEDLVTELLEEKK